MNILQIQAHYMKSGGYKMIIEDTPTVAKTCQNCDASLDPDKDMMAVIEFKSGKKALVCITCMHLLHNTHTKRRTRT